MQNINNVFSQLISININLLSSIDEKNYDKIKNLLTDRNNLSNTLQNSQKLLLDMPIESQEQAQKLLELDEKLLKKLEQEISKLRDKQERLLFMSRYNK